MSHEESFEWLDPQEAESQLRQKKAALPSNPNIIDLAVIAPASPEENEVMPGRQYEPRGYVNSHIRQAQRHLDQLWVVGASNLSETDFQQLGPYLAREDSYREDAVFQLLSWRRKLAPEYLRPYMTVKKEHLLMYGLYSQAGQLSLEKLSRTNTLAARNKLQHFVNRDELEHAMLASDFQRRIIRTLFYILREPTGSSKNFLHQLKTEAEDGQPLSLNGLMHRTKDFTLDQFEKHAEKHSKTSLETEENLVALLEEGRLERLKSMAINVLATGLEVIPVEDLGASD